jgi:hypothetical protein
MTLYTMTGMTLYLYTMTGMSLYLYTMTEIACPRKVVENNLHLGMLLVICDKPGFLHYWCIDC